MLFATDLTRVERNLLWAEAVYTAAYVRHRVPNNRTGNNVTPLEMWTGSKPDIGHLRVFGSVAYVHVPDCKRKKFDAKSHKTVFVGYDWLTTKVFRVFDREKRAVEPASDVKVEEQDSTCNDVFVRHKRHEDATRTSIILSDEDEPERSEQTWMEDHGAGVDVEAEQDDRAENDVFHDVAADHVARTDTASTPKRGAPHHS